MEPLQLIQLTIGITGLVLASINFLRKRKERDILLILVGLVLIALLLSLLGLVGVGR